MILHEHVGERLVERDARREQFVRDGHFAAAALETLHVGVDAREVFAADRRGSGTDRTSRRMSAVTVSLSNQASLNVFALTVVDAEIANGPS